MAIHIQTPIVWAVDGSALQVQPAPVYLDRNPDSNDTGPIGAIVINRLTLGVYALAKIDGVSVWVTNPGSGVGQFTSMEIDPGDLDVLTGDTNLQALTVNGVANFVTDVNFLSGTITINADLDLSSASAIELTTTADVPQALYLHANGGTASTLELRNQTGTDAAAVSVLSDVGGVTIEGALNANIESAGLISIISTRNNAQGILINSTAGGMDLTAVGSAGEDIDITATGSSINIVATEADASAIVINASNAAGGLSVSSGSAGMAISSTGNVSLASSAGTLLIDSSGVLEINSSAGVISIAADAVNQNVNIATGGTRVLTLGSTAGASQVVIDSGTAGVSVGASANSHPVVVGSTSGTSSLTLQSGTGDVIVTSTDAILVDATGLLELNSSGAAINIGNDAVAQNISIGSAGARVISIGNSSSTTTVNLVAGSGGIDLDAAGLVTMTAATDSQASPSDTATINAQVCSATFTGFTTASAASQVFTITNSIITATSQIVGLTACNEGSNDAQMSVMRIERDAGNLEVTLTNNGAQALNGDVTITFWVIN